MPSRRSNTKLNVAVIRRKRRGIEREATDFLAGFHLLERIDSWLQMLLDCHAFAIDQHHLGVRQQYMQAYATVSSSAFAIAECARLLLLRGLHGTAIAVTRTLAAQNDLVADFSMTDNSAAKWLRLRSMSPEDKSPEAKSLRKYFLDAEVRRRVASMGEKPLSDSLQGVLSEAVHVTPWGSHFYSSESLSEPGLFYVEHSPQFHPSRLLQYFNLLLATLPHLSGYFLQACNGDFGGKSNRFDLLTSRYFLLLDVYESEGPKMRELLRRLEEAEDRVRAGEPFDEVFSADNDGSRVQ
jgi:hypothetical protein